jgi:hypothetical protein
MARPAAPGTMSAVLDNYRVLWAIVFVILLGFIVYLVYIPIKIAKERRDPNKDASAACAVLPIFVWPLWIVSSYGR